MTEEETEVHEEYQHQLGWRDQLIMELKAELWDYYESCSMLSKLNNDYEKEIEQLREEVKRLRNEND